MTWRLMIPYDNVRDAHARNQRKTHVTRAPQYRGVPARDRRGRRAMRQTAISRHGREYVVVILGVRRNK